MFANLISQNTITTKASIATMREPDLTMQQPQTLTGSLRTALSAYSNNVSTIIQFQIPVTNTGFNGRALPTSFQRQP